MEWYDAERKRHRKKLIILSLPKRKLSSVHKFLSYNLQAFRDMRRGRWREKYVLYA